ncbi:MAG: YabP/YqfC family sporulation protein [Clostridia bacterium]|nr:YabP/YqfC family sporulation protein [Clostridia bacterium]
MKKSFGHMIADKFDIPIEGIKTMPCAQFIGNTMLNIDGCMGIKKYENEEIIIRTQTYLLTIVGQSLSMLMFSEGRVSIRGEIFCYRISEL